MEITTFTQNKILLGLIMYKIRIQLFHNVEVAHIL